MLRPPSQRQPPTRNSKLEKGQEKDPTLAKKQARKGRPPKGVFLN